MITFKELRDRLLEVYFKTWVCHWVTRAGSSNANHEILGKLYDELQDFIDELTETKISDGVTNPELFPIAVGINEISDSPVADLVVSLKALRSQWVEVSDKILDDIKSRMISCLSHYIFLLDTTNASYKLFSNKDADLLVKLRSLFKDQNEFVLTFNAYLKSKELPNKEVEKFFKDNEEELNNLSDSILTANTKLFDLRNSLVDADAQTKKDFNTLVKFFDVYCLE